MTEQKPALRPTPLALAVGAALSLSGSAAALAADRAGRVLTSIGPVVARTEDGSTRSLSRGSRVYAGDVILTSRGRVQIRFRDGAMVSLQPNTRFQVERYETEEEDEDGGGSAIMRLFQGALRTITGAIGDEPDEEYRMETPVATVGIRGTQYALQYCEGDACGNDVPQGLYGHVLDEGVRVSNAGGTGSFARGAYFKVSDGDTPPSQILQPPGDLFRGDGAEGEGGEEGSTETGGGDAGSTDGTGGDSGEGALTEASDTQEVTDSTTDEYTVSSETSTQADEETTSTNGGGSTDPFTVVTGAVGGAVLGTTSGGAPFVSGGTCFSDSQCTAEVDDNGNLRLIDLADLQQLDATGNVSLAESGTVSALGVTWGRWDGEFTVETGTDSLTVTGGFPWAYSENPATTTQLSNAFSGSGNLLFDTLSGPSPVGTVNGDAWSVSALNVAMSFSGGTANIGFGDVLLELTGPGFVRVGNGADTPTIDPSAGDRGFGVSLVESGGDDQGSLSGLFVGDGADGLLLEFNVEDFDYNGNLQEVISGVKIVEPGN